MKIVRIAASILAIVLPYSLAGSSDKATKSTEPLTPDEIAIYKAVVQQYVGDSSDNPGTLNVSNLTYPFDLTSPMTGLTGNGCLKGIQLDNLAIVSRSFHDLPPSILPNKLTRLVDAKEQSKLVHENDPNQTIRNGKSVDTAVASAFSVALFSMSEIAFDKERKRAVVSYGFWCGSLCGNGGTWVFEKVGSEWKKTDRNCGSWVS